jgi:flagellar motor switch protein FliN/FliY
MADLNVLLDAWAAELGQALEMMTGQPFRVSSPSVRAAPGDASLWWMQPFSPGGEAALSVGAAPSVWQELGRRALEGAGIEEAEEAEARNTWLEIVQQSVSGAARVFGTRIGKPVDCGQGSEGSAGPQAAQYFSASVAAPDGTAFGLEVAVSAELAAALAAPEPVPPAAAPAAVPPGPAVTSRTMDVLLDVHLPVSISFGTAQLPLRDVLKLASGSVVELNRLPEEPVEVIVNDHVIARGEVVVVDGNYAVRIQEIVSRQQRLSVGGPGHRRS